LLVLLPPSKCGGDIFLLAFFRPATKKDYKPVAVFAEVNPVLVNTGPNPLGIRILI
jgi:hypothetical protein